MLQSYDGPARWAPSWSAQNAELLSYSEERESFRALIRWVYEIFRTGKTSDVRSFDRYFLKGKAATVGGRKFKPKGDMNAEEFLSRLNLSPSS